MQNRAVMGGTVYAIHVQREENRTLRRLRRALRGAADGVPRRAERGKHISADAYPRAALRPHLRRSVRTALRSRRAAAFKRAHRYAADGDSARDDGRARRVRPRVRPTDACRSHRQALSRPLRLFAGCDARGPRRRRACARAALCARAILHGRVGDRVFCYRPAVYYALVKAKIIPQRYGKA